MQTPSAPRPAASQPQSAAPGAEPSAGAQSPTRSARGAQLADSGRGASRGIGILCALPEELGHLPQALRARTHVQGLELLELDPRRLPGANEHASELDALAELGPLLACVCGVGKVAAARASAILFERGVRRALLVVGTCGGLARALGPGALVHCEHAIQADFALRAERRVEPDAELLAAWSALVPGTRASYLTADRPVLSRWRRARALAAYPGSGAADMETAAAAACARAAGVPWAALRAVTDRAGALGGASFRLHFPVQAGRAADTIPALLHRLARAPRAG
jgi:nucleoside phosphorylase